MAKQTNFSIRKYEFFARYYALLFGLNNSSIKVFRAHLSLKFANLNKFCLEIALNLAVFYIFKFYISQFLWIYFT